MFSGSNFGYWLSKSLDLFKGQVIEFLVINSRESSLHRQVYRYTYVWKFRFFGCNSCTHCRPVFFFATNDLIQENCRLWTCFRNAGIKAMSRGILFHAKCTARVWTSFTTVLLFMRTSTVQWSLLPKICHLKKFFIFCCLKQTNLPAIPCTITFYHFFALLRHHYVNKVYWRYQGKEFLRCDDISAGFENWAVDIRRLKWTERLWSLSGHGCSPCIPNKIINYNEINK